MSVVSASVESDRGKSHEWSNLSQIPAKNHAAAEVPFRGVDPHPIGDLWIIRGHKMGEDERLDAGILRDAACVGY